MNKVGFINGCFDILHIGHVELLSHAKSKCDYLIVGLDSDKRVAQLKGPSRPINKLIRGDDQIDSSGCDDGWL